MKKVMLIMSILVAFNVSAGMFDNIQRSSSSQFLPADSAFPYSITKNEKDITIIWTIPHGYYMYKDKVSITTNGSIVPFNFLIDAIVKYDPNFDKDMSIFYEFMEITIEKNKINSQFNIKYQGCAEGGLCYIPQKRSIDLSE